MIRSIRFTLFVCLVLSLYSLNTLAQKAELELVAGPAMVSTRFSAGNNSNRKIKIAPLAGIGFNYHLTNHWSAGAQLLYERKGFKTEGKMSLDQYSDYPFYFNSNSIKYRLNTNLDYLTLPVMVRYSFGTKIQWSAGAGGYISHLLKAKQHQTLYVTPTYKDNFDVTKWYNKTDAGICVVIGMAIPVTEKLRLKGSLIESIGLIDIFQSQGSTRDEMTNSLSLQVGISYLLGKSKANPLQ